MTAYLKPGDHIHLAFPISPTLHGPALERQVEAARSSYTAFYARLGVNVAYYDASSELAAPVVIAVFRGDANHVEGDPA